MLRLQPRLHTPMNPNPTRLLLGNEPTLPQIQSRLHSPRVVSLLEPILERDEFENPPEPTQVELIIYRGQRVLEI